MGQNEMGHKETSNGTPWNEMEDVGRCKGSAGDAYVSEGIKRSRGRIHAGIRNGAWDRMIPGETYSTTRGERAEGTVRSGHCRRGVPRKAGVALTAYSVDML